jgi:signal transduction histidine kinase
VHLLKKTITVYFIYSAILLVIAIPIFYFALKKMIVQSVDENLISTKTIVIPQLQNNILNHRESSLVLAGYDIHYEKEPSDTNEDSIYTIETTSPESESPSPNRELVSHFYVKEEFYSLHIITTLTDKFSLIKRIIWIVAFLLVVLFLGLVLMNRVLTKNIWLPFYKTLGSLKKYRVDKQAVLQLESSRINEFNDLNQAIEDLAETNYQTYLSQKEFTENASHEMQSPLAVFQSKLELLMQTNPLNEEQASLIADLASASKRMHRLNKALILLTRIDNDQFLEKETISVREILKKLIKHYEFPIASQSIQFSFDDGEDVLIEANRTLIEIMLGNLLSNAIRHNLPNGIVQVSLTQKELTIQNSGRGIPLDNKKIFRRFQKESDDEESIGLGLEIVNKICARYQYNIQYHFRSQMHIFTVRF